MNSDVPGGLPSDDLLGLQMRVARRADELALTRQGGTSLNLQCWLLAEAEILGMSVGSRTTGLAVGRLAPRAAQP